MGKKLLELLGKRKKEDYIVLALLGLLLLTVVAPSDALGGLSAGKKGDAPSQEGAAAQEAARTAPSWGEEYGSYWEKRLEGILSEVEGAGEVRVAIGLEDGGGRVVEKDVPVSRSTTSEADSNGGIREIREFSSQESTLVVTQGDGGQAPYVVRETAPKISGVLVIAEGGDDPRVKEQITRLLQALFDLEVHKIVVAKMKTG